MINMSDPGDARLRQLFRTAAWSRDTLCVFPDENAQEVVDSTKIPAKVAVFDGKDISDSKTVLPTPKP